MKKVVVINSTPRVNGNSEVLAREFARGAREAGHEVEIINLREHNLNYCIGCYACHSTGKCFHKDKMNDFADTLKNADAILFATPVYFYSMSGQLKVFIDRLCPVYTEVRADIYMLATQWDTDTAIMDKVFEAIRGCTRDCFEECEEKGVLYGAGLSDIGDAEKNAEYMSIAYNMGKNIQIPVVTKSVI